MGLREAGLFGLRSEGREGRELATDQAPKKPQTQAAIDLEGVLDDEETVLDELERCDQHPAEDAIEEDGFPHLVRVLGRRTFTAVSSLSESTVTLSRRRSERGSPVCLSVGGSAKDPRRHGTTSRAAPLRSGWEMATLVPERPLGES